MDAGENPRERRVSPALILRKALAGPEFLAALYYLIGLSASLVRNVSCRRPAVLVLLSLLASLLPASSYALQVGNRVQTTDALNVRSCASASSSCGVIGVMPSGSIGEIHSGPSTGSGYTWWQVQWSGNGLIGYSVQDYLAGIPPASFALSNEVPVCDFGDPVGPAVRINWTRASGAARYDVYRNGSLYSPAVPSTELSFNNNRNLVAGQTYTYQIVARSDYGDTQSNVISVSIPVDVCASAGGPVSPTNLFALAGEGFISLAWDDNSNNETQFRLERKAGTNGAWVLIGATSADFAAYRDYAVELGVTYSYRVFAYSDTLGASGYSNEASATLGGQAPGAPVMTSGECVIRDSTSVLLAGTANPSGSDTTVWFEWGETSSYGNVTVEESVGSGTNAVSVSQPVLNLVPGTTYYFRVAGRNSAGTSYGSESICQLTQPPEPPGVQTTSATYVSATSATLNGYVSANGAPTSVWFEWGTSTGYGNTTPATPVGADMYDSVSAQISGLTSGTRYHFRMVAENAAGRTYGSDKSFVAAGIGEPIPGQWVSTAGPPGAVERIVVDPSTPNTLYAATWDRIYRSADSGDNWQELSALPDNTIYYETQPFAVHPVDSRILYAGTYNGVYKSVDGGASWNDINNGLGGAAITALVINPRVPSIVYAGTMNGVYKSVDGGGLWSAANAGLDAVSGLYVKDLVIDPINTDILYAVTEGGLYRTLNGGATWIAIGGELSSGAVNLLSLIIDQTTPTTLYAGTSAGVYKSVDRGTSWVPTGVGPYYTYSIAIDPTTPSNLYAATGEAVYKSANAGTSWIQLTGVNTTNVYEVAVDPRIAGTVYIGTRRGAYRSRDGGASWAAVSSGIRNSSVISLVADPLSSGVLYAGTYGGVFKSINGGSSWAASGNFDSYVGSLAIVPSSPNVIYAGTSSGVYKSIDGGQTWSIRNTGIDAVNWSGFPPPWVLGFMPILAIDPVTPNTVYVALAGAVFKSTTGGDAWTLVSWADPYTYSVTDLAIDPNNQSTLYAATSQGIIKSIDAGVTWSPPLANAQGWKLALDPHNPSVLYAGGDGVMKSVDGGVTWESANAGLDHANFNTVMHLLVDPVSPNTVYVITSQGVYRSTDGAHSWRPMSNWLANTWPTVLAVDPQAPNTPYVGTDNLGVFKWTGALSNGISGRITTSNGQGLGGATLALTGVANRAGSSLSDGSYSFTGLALGTYTVTPFMSGYTFDPPSIGLAVTTQGLTYSGQNFRACQIGAPLTGRLTDATTSAGLSGITVTADGQSDVTDANGNYSITGLSCGTHTVNVQGTSSYSSYSYTQDSFNGWSHDIQLTSPSTTNGLNTNSGYAADPVNTATGNYTYERRDLEIPGTGMSFAFTRAYNAQDASVVTATDGPLGYGWTYNYNTSLSVDPAGNVTLRWGDGRTETYAPDGAGGFTPQYGVFDTLVDNGNGTYSLNRKDLSHYHFDTSGRLAAIVDKNGNGITLTYTGSDLTRVTDTVGRNIDFAYDANHHITRIDDPIGRTVQFGYDASGNLTSATDPNGNTTAYSYDAEHQMLSITDPRGNTVVSNTYDALNRVVTYQEDAKGGATRYVYEELDRKTTIMDALDHITVHYHDPLLRLTKEIDARGMVALYEYDDRGNRTKVTDKNGNVTQYGYDADGNVTSKTDALDNVTTITYDSSNNPQTRTDALGRTTTFTYDGQGNLIETRDAAGNTADIAYDPTGLPVTLTDALGRVTTNTYDAQGNLVTVCDALGNETHYTYDGAGRRLSQTDALGHATTFAYDANNNLLSTTDADGNAVSHEYDGNNNRVRTTDRLGNITSIVYDVKDLPVQATDPPGGTVITQYDALDRRVAVTDQNNHTTQFAYDEVGNLIRVTDALGNITTNVYDPNGNLLAVTDPLGHTSHSTYDALNRRVAASDALGNTTVMAYDALGQTVSTTNAKGQTTSFVYDVLGRLLLVTDAEGGTVRYEYDAVGNRTLMQDPNGNLTTYAYDDVNRLTTKTEPLGNLTRTEYDAVGNLTRVTKSNGTVIAYGYDNLNRLADVTYPDTSGVGFVYDAEGRRTQMTDSLGTTQYGYDDLGRITQITDPYGNTVGYGYDAVGNRTSLSYPGNKFVLYAYDANNRMTGVTDWLARTTSYSYDAAGRLMSANNPNGTAASYAYDNADRLTSLTNAKADSTVISSYAYTLDPIGNHTQVVQDEPLPPVHTPGTVTYVYDTENRLTSVNGVPNSYDDNGNMTSRGADSFVYDFEDRLVQSTIEGVASQYQYDGLGNRYAKTAGGVTTRYLLDTNTKLTNVLAELDAGGTVQAYYVYGLGLVSRIEPDGTTRCYHYDSRGSAVSLSDSTGTITDSYAYDAFGKVINMQGGSQNPFRYIGGYGVVDDGNGMQYVRARYYDPGSGRFVNKDLKHGSGKDGQDLNRYAYALNTPTTLVDISGYSPSQGVTRDNANRSSDNINQPLLLANAEMCSVIDRAIPTYGRYGGPCWTAGQWGGVLGTNNWKQLYESDATRPIDQLDRLFFSHDLAYAEASNAYDRSAADRMLAQGLRDVRGRFDAGDIGDVDSNYMEFAYEYTLLAEKLFVAQPAARDAKSVALGIPKGSWDVGNTIGSNLYDAYSWAKDHVEKVLDNSITGADQAAMNR